jgi:GT2 family glycosyltransferase
VIALTVIVPTVGRPELLERCLASIAAARPAPEEILVVDQSEDGATRALAVRFPRVRVERSEPRGVAVAMNLGLRLARTDHVVVTHDDCTVEPDWLEAAAELVGEEPGALFTGRVLPGGDPKHVPSTKVSAQPARWQGDPRTGVLYPNNMALDRRLALDIGGFDPRFRWSEDNDFCYRWLRAGHVLRFEPRLVVHHHDWRSRAQLQRLYLRYGRGQGEFYAKHLRMGDRRMLTFLRWDAKHLGFALKARVRGRPLRPEWRAGYFAGIPLGLLSGLRRFARRP